MAKQPAPTSTVTWWLDPSPIDGWTQHCSAQFDVRLSRKLGKGITPRANADATSKKSGINQSRSIVQSNMGIRRTSGFGIK